MDYLDVLAFRFHWVLVPMVVVTALSLGAAFVLPKQYRSSTLIMVESEKIPHNFIPQVATEQPRERMQTVKQEVLARTRLERVLDELNPYPDLARGMSQSRLVEMMRERISIGMKGDDAFSIEYTDTVPRRAQQIASRLATLFIEETSRDRKRQVEGAQEFIESQLDETRKELERHETTLRDYKERYMGMLPEQLNANLSTLQRLQREQQTIIETTRAAKDRKALLERQLTDQSRALRVSTDSSVASESPTEHLVQLRAELTALRARYTEEHPDVKALLARIRKLERELAGSGEDPSKPVFPSGLKGQIQAAELDIQTQERRQNEIQEEIRKYQARVEMTPKVEQELQALNRDYEKRSKYYSELLSRRLEATTAGALEERWKGEQFRILDPADFPDSSVSPRKLVFLIVGAAVGLAVGIGLALLLEFLDHSIKDPGELEALVPSYPILLTIPRIPTEKEKIVARRKGGASGV